MVRTKIQLLEMIHELKKEDVKNKDFYEKLYYDVRDNKISIDDAEKSLIISETFYRKVEGKPVAENMQKFSTGKLKDDIKILKMVSSIITQLFIMKEQNPEFNIINYNYFDLLNLLNEYGKTNEIDKYGLAQIITDLGCFVDKNLYPQKVIKQTSKKTNKIKTKDNELQNVDVEKLKNNVSIIQKSTLQPNDTPIVTNNISQTNTMNAQEIQENNLLKIQEALKSANIDSLIQ